jgi:aspartate oxidase
VKENKNIKIFDHTFVIDLITKDGTCNGAVAWHAKKGNLLIWAKLTILATGGCGQVYRETTNPDVATGMDWQYIWAGCASGWSSFTSSTTSILGAYLLIRTRGEG